MEGKKEWKILVVSDSHGNNDQLRKAIGQEMPIDMLIHCGDSETDLKAILGSGRDYELEAVRGNMDYGTSYPDDLLLRVGYYNIFVAHGHKYGTKYTNEQILDAGRKRLADVVLCGHSHVPEIERTEDGILLVNPGSVALPHQDPPRCSYAVLRISEDEMPSAEIRYMRTNTWR